MSSIFRVDDNYVDKPKRNSFDMSHQNNLTLKFGELVPVLCQEVVPGDSVKIDPSFGLRYMPQVFPVQTRQRASIKYYYVRNRNLWNGWMDFIGKTKEGLTPPYINFKNGEQFEFLRPSSVADYMGVPIKIDTPAGFKTFSLCSPIFNQGNNRVYIPNTSTAYSSTPNEPFAVISRKKLLHQLSIPTTMTQTNGTFELTSIYGARIGTNNPYLSIPTVVQATAHGNIPLTTFTNVNFALFRRGWVVKPNMKIQVNNAEIAYVIFRTIDGVDVAEKMTVVDGKWTLERSNLAVSYLSVDTQGNPSTHDSFIRYIVGIMTAKNSSNTTISTPVFDVFVDIQDNDGLCWCDVSLNDLPFCSDVNPNGVRLNALPFRAITSVHNALIRNAENNPLLINGVPEYNKYILSDEGGAVTDTTDILSTKYCNWSDDRFTTALPSPQQGNAPLVGLTGVAGATVTLGNEDGSQTVVHLQVDSETGNVVMVDGVSGGNNNPQMTHAMMSAVDYGITINDLRNVNSFQRWLENNIRRGYKYKDQLMSHYGVNARFDVLDMPEFIGGVSRDVNVQQVTQTVENEYGNLGDYAGQSYIMGEGHSIEHYCDEHGFIIGLMCVYPMPLYQDTLPKYLIKSDPFDYFFPEFSKIGMQPISNKELAFSQSVISGTMDETFGYQRAWYDYLENLDSVHGLFRTDLRNYLIARDFYGKPSLSPDFLTISSDDLNNTFYSDDDEDKIIGQIFHKMSMKRPIPVVGIPAIE